MPYHPAETTNRYASGRTHELTFSTAKERRMLEQLIVLVSRALDTLSTLKASGSADAAALAELRRLNSLAVELGLCEDPPIEPALCDETGHSSFFSRKPHQRPYRMEIDDIMDDLYKLQDSARDRMDHLGSKQTLSSATAEPATEDRSAPHAPADAAALVKALGGKEWATAKDLSQLVDRKIDGQLSNWVKQLGNAGPLRRDVQEPGRAAKYDYNVRLCHPFIVKLMSADLRKSSRKS